MENFAKVVKSINQDNDLNVWKMDTFASWWLRDKLSVPLGLLVNKKQTIYIENVGKYGLHFNWGAL